MTGQSGEQPVEPERHETPAERSDRLWHDLVQELRVIQTGTQLTAGFLLTLPFQQRFEGLSDAQRGFYLALITLAGVVTALVLTPIAIHRRLTGRHVKQRLVDTTGKVMRVVLPCLGLLVVATTTFVFGVVTSTTTAVVAGAVLGVLLFSLLVVVPRRLVG